MNEAQPLTALAEFLCRLDTLELPEPAVVCCEAALLDHLACGIRGASTTWAAIVADQARDEAAHGDGPAPVYGRGFRLDPGRAARANGTAAHSLELDDIHEGAMIHPGAAVVPAALAVGAALGAGGRATLAAIVAGYEAMTRISLATGLGHKVRFHATGTIGPFGAAAAASRLHGLPADVLAHAWGVSASLAGGTKAFQDGGGMVKRLHPGRAAESGILAAALAQRGFTGPPEPLLGDKGFVAAYGRDDGDAGALAAGLGGRYAVEDIYVKPYATCGQTHSAVLAMLELSARHALTARDIARLRVGTTEHGYRQNRIPQPTDVMSAQYSIECSVALALFGDVRDVTDLEAGFWNRPEVRALIDRTEVYVDPVAESRYPRWFGTALEVETVDGDVHRHRRDGGPRPGTPEKRWRQVLEKFTALTGPVLTGGAQERIVEAVTGLKDGRPLDDLTTLLGDGPAPRAVRSEPSPQEAEGSNP